MTSEGEYSSSASQEWLDDLDRVRYEVYAELADYGVSDQLIDINPKGEHYRCTKYLAAKYTEMMQQLPLQTDWPELSADGRGEANAAMFAANMYRIEKDFQDSMISDAVITRRIMEKIEDQLEAGEEVDREFFWATAFNKKQCQIIFDLYYAKELDDPWQKFYHGVTEQFGSVDYSDPDDVAAFVNTQSSYWHFEEICATHNMILREAAEKAGLYKIQDDPEMLLRLATILVETQMIAMRDRENGIVTDGIKQYGEQWKIGDKLIEMLAALYNERYSLD